MKTNTGNLYLRLPCSPTTDISIFRAKYWVRARLFRLVIYNSQVSHFFFLIFTIIIRISIL